MSSSLQKQFTKQQAVVDITWRHRRSRDHIRQRPTHHVELDPTVLLHLAFCPVVHPSHEGMCATPSRVHREICFDRPHRRGSDRDEFQQDRSEPVQTVVTVYRVETRDPRLTISNTPNARVRWTTSRHVTRPRHQPQLRMNASCRLPQERLVNQREQHTAQRRTWATPVSTRAMSHLDLVHQIGDATEQSQHVLRFVGLGFAVLVPIAAVNPALFDDFPDVRTGAVNIVNE